MKNAEKLPSLQNLKDNDINPDFSHISDINDLSNDVPVSGGEVNNLPEGSDL